MRRKKEESSNAGAGREESESLSAQSNKSGIEQKILENLVELQKVHTSLAERFDKLAGEISKLLTLFEMAARSFAEQPANQVAERDKDFLDKVDRLLEQNKTIAKALTLVEERMRERMYGLPFRGPAPPSSFTTASVASMKERKPEEETSSSQQSARPLPRF